MASAARLNSVSTQRQQEQQEPSSIKGIFLSVSYGVCFLALGVFSKKKTPEETQHAAALGARNYQGYVQVMNAHNAEASTADFYKKHFQATGLSLIQGAVKDIVFSKAAGALAAIALGCYTFTKVAG